MVIYHIRLRQFRVDVDVPNDVKGLTNVANYITDELASKYADSFAKIKKEAMRPVILEKVIAEMPRGTSQEVIDERVEEELEKVIEPYRNSLHTSYFDSHLPSITEFLKDLYQKLEGRR
jgi:cell division ATPase FtsA